MRSASAGSSLALASASVAAARVSICVLGVVARTIRSVGTSRVEIVRRDGASASAPPDSVPPVPASGLSVVTRMRCGRVARRAPAFAFHQSRQSVVSTLRRPPLPWTSSAERGAPRVGSPPLAGPLGVPPGVGGAVGEPATGLPPVGGVPDVPGSGDAGGSLGDVGAVAGGAVGAATGGIIDAMVDNGVSRKDAEVYAETVRRGGTVVSVRTEDARRQTAEAILDRHTAIDLTKRRGVYETAGWKGYSPEATPLTRAEIDAERSRYL